MVCFGLFGIFGDTTYVGFSKRSPSEEPLSADICKESQSAQTLKHLVTWSQNNLE